MVVNKAESVEEQFMKKVLLLCLIAITIIGLVACSQDNKTYRISFDANGGTGEKMADIVAPDHKEVTLTKNTYTRTGYVFTGWSEDKDAYYAYYGDEEVCEFKDDTTLYAVWEADLSSSVWEAQVSETNKIRLVFDDKGGFTLTDGETAYTGDFIVVADSLMLAFTDTKSGDPTVNEAYAYFKSPEDMSIMIVDPNGDRDPATLEFVRDFDHDKYYYPADYETISGPELQEWKSVTVNEYDGRLTVTAVLSTRLTAHDYAVTATREYTCNPEHTGKPWTFSITTEHTTSDLISTGFEYKVTAEKSTLKFYFIDRDLEFTKVVDE